MMLVGGRQSIRVVSETADFDFLKTELTQMSFRVELYLLLPKHFPVIIMWLWQDLSFSIFIFVTSKKYLFKWISNPGAILTSKISTKKL